MEDSFISPVVDLFREILYDILGLFLPGAALLLILHSSPFETLRNLVAPLTRFDTGIEVVAFIAGSYVVGYSVQGFAGRLWGIVIVRILQAIKKPLPMPANNEIRQGMNGISPAFLQVKGGIEDSELVKTLRTQIATYCGIAKPEDLSINEIQNLCYSLSGDRADDAFAFSFRADLSNGMFLISVLGFFQTLLAYCNLSLRAWFASLFVYSILATGFALRAWTYFNIRGRIIYSIGLASVSDSINERKQKEPLLKN